MDLNEYRKSEREKKRIEDLMRIIPKGRSTILDIGARDGYISALMTSYFQAVTALDLEKHNFNISKVSTVKGDVTSLQFSDNYFDVVLCAEVLEHIPARLLDKACAEIARVAKFDVVIGVPYKQDVRVGRTTCFHCGHHNPPWGHVNSFDESTLINYFKMISNVTTSYVGKTKSKTNALSAVLMDLAGNPWGTYSQEEPCVHCGNKLVPLPTRNVIQRLCSKLAVLQTRFQLLFVSSEPEWMHMVFMKNPYISG